MEFLYIQRVLNGDVSQFSYFVDTYQHMAYSVAFSIVNNPQDAEDAVQDAYVKAYKSLRHFRQDAKFSTWFYKIVVNTALTKIKQNKAANYVATDAIPDAFIEHTEAAYQRLAHEEQRKYIDRALNELPAEDRLILTLYYLHEHSMEETTEITGIPTENLKMKLHRARKKMYVALNSVLKSETKNIL